jgi:UDP-glucose 6-dehydrogenase
MSRIAVIGTGYVGLTTGACFAQLGHEVICADIDADKVARLNDGEIPILEPGLDRVVEEGRASGRLTFVLGAATAARQCEFAYLCVPTPQGADGSADLSYIEAAAREIGPVLPPDAVVINKSTVPVGSTKVVERALGRPDVHVVSNPEFLRPGPGWGGSCFPKDTLALIAIAEDHGYDFRLLKGVVEVNEEQFARVADKVVRMAGGSIAGVKIAAWGLTFKARTDDLRESPALEILGRLASLGADIRAYDPAVKAPLARLDAEICADPYAACEGAEVLIVLTEWDEFKWLDMDKVRELMSMPRVVDARNLLDRSALLRRGFTYQGIGRS